jgi:tetraacyldisaccharide 4'-kinase
VNEGRFWKAPLQPLGWTYLGLMRLRAWLYASRRLERVPLPRPAVSVGNLTFGGTGKTPVTVFLARLVRELGGRPAVLLRGYGRLTRGARLAGPAETSETVGEEAILLARSLPGVPVAVGERREEAAALVADDSDLLLLDDAFQHLRVRRDLDLLLVDASRPGDLRAPPLGRLREPLKAARRADMVLVTRGGAADLPRALKTWTGGIPVLGCRFPWSRSEPKETSSAWWHVARSPLVAFAGIGNAEAFFAQAEQEGLRIVSALAFPDHAAPTAERLAAVHRAAREAGAAAVLTTAKDAVKWAPLWPGDRPLVWPEQEVELEDPEGALRGSLARLLEGRR